MTEDEIRSQREKCTDCGGQLQEIQVVESTRNAGAVPLRFGTREAKTSFWSGAFPAEGTVMAFMCSSCARIAFYGATKEE